MNDKIELLRGILFLEDKTYFAFLDKKNPMKQGIFILLVCFLIVAFPAAISQLIDNVTPFTPERAAIFQEDFLEGFENALQFMPQDENTTIFMEQFRENFAMGTNIAVEIGALPTPLPKPVGGFLQALGSLLSAPFWHLATWLGYGIWVLLFAKLSGGFGGINRSLGLTALYAVPNLLGFFSFIPFLGPVITFVGMIWGWAVYVKALEVSQETSVAKAILLAVLPVLVFIAVIFLFTILGIIALIIGSN